MHCHSCTRHVINDHWSFNGWQMVQSRARSEGAKQARRQFILATADQLLRGDGFDAFTMNKLASAADLAKGTLYLYFTTREELVLALYTDLHDGWIDQFLDAEKQMPVPNYGDLCARFYQSFAADPLLVDLAARATSGLEPHVPLAAWIAAKQAQTRSAKRLGGLFCHRFGCDPAQAQRLAWAFLAALSGAQQRAIDPGDDAEIPETLQKLAKTMSFKDVFLNMVLPLAPSLSE
jgi:AcrR family transcriptional regulator